MAEYYERLKQTMIPHIMLIMGGLYLLWSEYLGYELRLITSWQTTSFLTVPYAFAIVYFVLRREDILRKNMFLCKLASMGKWSFYIFLTQQVYYSTEISNRIFKKFGLITTLILNILICVGIGFLFYYIVDRFVRTLISLLLKNK